MQPDEEHVALPHLFGAPAYARPPLRITPAPLPPDPDDLPIAAVQTPEERQLAERLLSSPYGTTKPVPAPDNEQQRRPQPFRLSALASKILRRAS